MLAHFAREFGVSREELEVYDNRVQVEEIKRLVQADPSFGFALRTVIDKDVKAEDLFKISKNKPDREKNE